MKKPSPWSNTSGSVGNIVDKLYNKLHTPQPEPVKQKEKVKYKRQFHAYLCYALDGHLVDVIESSEEGLKKHNPEWKKNSLNSVSSTHGRYAGCSCYGYFWRRQKNENDLIPKQLNDDILKKYKQRMRSVVGPIPKGLKITFKAFLRYDLDGNYIDTILNTDEALAKVNKKFVRGSIYSSSLINEKRHGRTRILYGYVWKRLVNLDDDFPRKIKIRM